MPSVKCTFYAMELGHVLSRCHFGCFNYCELLVPNDSTHGSVVTCERLSAAFAVSLGHFFPEEDT